MRILVMKINLLLRFISLFLLLNYVGIAYSQRCPSEVIDIEDNIYATVILGEQCWLKENMRATTGAHGESLTYYSPGDDEGNVAKYGYLYTWESAKQVCPEGWHLPSMEEWRKLTIFVRSQERYQCGGVSENISKAMSVKKFWKNNLNPCSIGNLLEENNLTGFSAFPAGTYSDGFYDDFGKAAHFWSSTPEGKNMALTRYLYYHNPYVSVHGDYIKNGLSVRCVYDGKNHIQDEEYDGEEYDGEEYDGEEYDGEEYDDEEYDGEEYDDEEYDDEEYDDEEYDDEEYDDEEYDDEEYDDEEYDDEEYDDEEYDDEEYDDEEYDDEEYDKKRS